MLCLSAVQYINILLLLKIFTIIAVIVQKPICKVSQHQFSHYLFPLFAEVKRNIMVVHVEVKARGICSVVKFYCRPTLYNS